MSVLIVISRLPDGLVLCADADYSGSQEVCQQSIPLVIYNLNDNIYIYIYIYMDVYLSVHFNLFIAKCYFDNSLHYCRLM